MKILITNDDGITAPGLLALVDRLKSEHEITVVAPDGERSGVAHSITFMRSFWVEPHRIHGVRAFTTSGTPADCVRWALSERCDLVETPELVLSGINRGYNCGFHVFYSGTVAAALQAAANNIRAIALSMDYDDMHNLAAIATVAVDLILGPLVSGFRGERTALNVNFPRFDEMQSTEVAWTNQSVVLEPEEFDVEAVAGEHRVYRPRMGHFVPPEPGSDRWAVRAGQISVTRLSCNLSA